MDQDSFKIQLQKTKLRLCSTIFHFSLEIYLSHFHIDWSQVSKCLMIYTLNMIYQDNFEISHLVYGVPLRSEHPLLKILDNYIN